MNTDPVSVLVVDDDADVLRGTARVLERAGFATVTAQNGEAALEVLHTYHPNLVLLDWNMPGMDGIEVCRRIKADPAFQDYLVILVSGVHTDSEEQAAGLESGADGYIARPIDNRELIARVKAFARIWTLNHALHETETRLRSILHAAPIGIGVVVDRLFTEVNDRILRMTGYDRDELLGQSSRILYPTDAEFERVGREKYAQIREQGRGALETRWQRKDGEIRDVYLSSAAIDSNDLNRGVTFTAEDITERKQAEAELEQHRHHLEALVEQRTAELARTETKASHILQSSADGLYHLHQPRRLCLAGLYAGAGTGRLAPRPLPPQYARRLALSLRGVSRPRRPAPWTGGSRGRRSLLACRWPPRAGHVCHAPHGRERQGDRRRDQLRRHQRAARRRPGPRAGRQGRRAAGPATQRIPR
jgi:PAS domain S-box-containing protein